MREASIVARWILPGLAVAVAAAAGCGVSDVTEGMFSGGDDPGGSGGSATTTTTTTTTTGTVNPTTTTTTSGGGQGGAGGGGTGGMGGSGGAGGSPVVMTLACGNAGDCSVPPSSACCWHNLQGTDQDTGMCIQGPPDQLTCNTSGDFNGGRRTRIECQLPSDCAGGMVCCGNYVGYYSDVTCQAQCSSVTLCDPANPVCPGNLTCQQSGSLPPGYFVCTQ